MASETVKLLMVLGAALLGAGLGPVLLNFAYKRVKEQPTGEWVSLEKKLGYAVEKDPRNFALLSELKPWHVVTPSEYVKWLFLHSYMKFWGFDEEAKITPQIIERERNRIEPSVIKDALSKYNSFLKNSNIPTNSATSVKDFLLNSYSIDLHNWGKTFLSMHYTNILELAHTYIGPAKTTEEDINDTLEEQAEKLGKALEKLVKLPEEQLTAFIAKAESKDREPLRFLLEEARSFKTTVDQIHHIVKQAGETFLKQDEIEGEPEEETENLYTAKELSPKELLHDASQVYSSALDRFQYRGYSNLVLDYSKPVKKNEENRNLHWDTEKPGKKSLIASSVILAVSAASGMLLASQFLVEDSLTSVVFTGLAMLLLVGFAYIWAVVDIHTLQIDMKTFYIGAPLIYLLAYIGLQSVGLSFWIVIGIGTAVGIALFGELVNRLMMLVTGKNGLGTGDHLLVLVSVGIPTAVSITYLFGYWTYMFALVIALSWGVVVSRQTKGLNSNRAKPFAFGPALLFGWVPVGFLIDRLPVIF